MSSSLEVIVTAWTTLAVLMRLGSSIGTHHASVETHLHLMRVLVAIAIREVSLTLAKASVKLLDIGTASRVVLRVEHSVSIHKVVHLAVLGVVDETLRGSDFGQALIVLTVGRHLW